jgi:hypothetical protein
MKSDNDLISASLTAVRKLTICDRAVPHIMISSAANKYASVTLKNLNQLRCFHITSSCIYYNTHLYVWQINDSDCIALDGYDP